MNIQTIALMVVALFPAMAAAEVSRVEIVSRHDVLDARSFGSTGPYELVAGKIHFAVDPANPANRLIVDIDKAPRSAAGRVEFVSDFSMLRPKDQARGNGVALIDIVNRGQRTVLTSFNRATRATGLSTEAEFGDGLVMRQGFTLVWVGWEFDVAPRDGLTRIEVPAAAGLSGVVRALLTPNTRTLTATFGDLVGYSPANPAAAENTLTMRDSILGAPTKIPRGMWQLSGNAVTLQEGFEPGRTYELSYTAANPPLSGLGFAAVRDTASWMKYVAGATASAKYVYAFGSSQSGRFLRDFLYHGFNADEQRRQVFDAVMANIAGASRLDINNRWATPTALAQFTATSFPFADIELADPITGVKEGALDNARARDHRPKIFYTNTGVEYWGGTRSAALIHTSPDGTRDLPLPDNERVYLLAGSQHGPAAFPSTVTNGQQKENPNNYWWTMRALLTAMDQWVRQGVAPPESRYPRLADGTLVRAADVAFPDVPTVPSPRSLTAGTRAANPLLGSGGGPGTALPLLVPQVDRDGNERAGIRLPDISVPLGTFTGWNFRKPAIGAPNQLFPLMGSYIPFRASKSERDAAHDPRASIEERYASRDRYVTLVQEAGSALVNQRVLLAEDLPQVLDRAARHYDMLMKGTNASTR